MAKKLTPGPSKGGQNPDFAGGPRPRPPAGSGGKPPHVLLNEQHLLWLLEGNVVTMKNAQGESIEVSLFIEGNDETQELLRLELLRQMPQLEDVDGPA